MRNMKEIICLLLWCLAAVSFTLPLRDGGKDTTDTAISSDALSPPTQITIKEMTDPTKLLVEDGKTDQPMNRRSRRDVPTPSPELANTTPLVIKGSVDDVEPPTPSEELASTTPLVIKDGNPDQWQRRLRRKAEQMPPTVALQEDPKETEVEKAQETPSEAIHPEGLRIRRRSTKDVVPELGMPLLRNGARKESGMGSSSEEEQVEDLGMPIPKHHVAHELPKTEDESGWSRPRRYADIGSAEEEETVTAQPKEVEMPEALSTAPLIVDRLQVETAAVEVTKENAEPTAAATPVMDRAADEIRDLTEKTPKSEGEVRRRRANRAPQVGRQASASYGRAQKELSDTESRRKRSNNDDGEDRMEEIEQVLAGKKMIGKEEESSARKKRSNESDDAGDEQVHHKKPGVAGVEEAGLAATLEEQTAHIQSEEDGQMVSASEKMPTEGEGKNERRRRRRANDQNAAVDVTGSEEKVQKAGTAGSELDTRTRGVGDRSQEETENENEANAEGSSNNNSSSSEEAEAKVSTRRRRSTDEESEDGYGESGTAGGMSAGHIKSDEEQQSSAEAQRKLRKKRSAALGQRTIDDNTFRGTPSPIGTGFHDTDCRGRVFC